MPEETSSDFHQLIAQLSPEEREQLALELSRDIQHPEETGDVAELAKAIEAHLSQNPEASVGDLPEEHQTAVDTVKSAEYIEGFLYQAMDNGVTIKQAIDMYDSALTDTLRNLKTAKLKGNQHKLDVDGDGKIEASDLKKLRHEAKESPKHEKAESPVEEKGEHMEETKTAAYYEGLFSRAAEYGLSKEAAASLIKQARGGFVPPKTTPFFDSTPALRKIRDYFAQGEGGSPTATNPLTGSRFSSRPMHPEASAAFPGASLFSAGTPSEQQIEKLKELGLNTPQVTGVSPEASAAFPGASLFSAGTPSEQQIEKLKELGLNTPQVTGVSPEASAAFPSTSLSLSTGANRPSGLLGMYGKPNSDDLLGNPSGQQDITPSALDHLKFKFQDVASRLRGAGERGYGALQEYLTEHPDIANAAPWVLGGLGAAGLGYGAYKALSKKKENENELQPKAAAYYEGLFKRASEYGLSQEQTIELLQRYSR